VHERFSADDLRAFRRDSPGIEILAHPECPPDVLAEADYVGSTSGMIQHVAAARPRRVVMVTECSMSDNVAVEFPDVEFVRPCALCPHMKRITLPKILRSLETMQHEVLIEPAMAARAKLAVDRMLAVRPRSAR
jgi:quinolinate synthase